jgi:hypothetical protein
MGFTVPTSAELGGYSSEIATAQATKGDYDTRVANALITLATEVNANATTAQAQINVPLSGGILAAGTPMAAWADNSSSNPGIATPNHTAVCEALLFQRIAAALLSTRADPGTALAPLAKMASGAPVKR